MNWWKLNIALLNNEWVKEKIKKEIDNGTARRKYKHNPTRLKGRTLNVALFQELRTNIDKWNLIRLSFSTAIKQSVKGRGSPHKKGKSLPTIHLIQG